MKQILLTFLENIFSLRNCFRNRGEKSHLNTIYFSFLVLFAFCYFRFHNGLQNISLLYLYAIVEPTCDRHTHSKPNFSYFQMLFNFCDGTFAHILSRSSWTFTHDWSLKINLNIFWLRLKWVTLFVCVLSSKNLKAPFSRNSERRHCLRRQWACGIICDLWTWT